MKRRASRCKRQGMTSEIASKVQPIPSTDIYSIRAYFDRKETRGRTRGDITIPVTIFTNVTDTVDKKIFLIMRLRFIYRLEWIHNRTVL